MNRLLLPLVMLLGSRLRLRSAVAYPCTLSQTALILKLNSEAAASSQCANGVDVTADLTAFCADSTCLATMSSLASELPNCEVSGVNAKSLLETALAQCGVSNDTNAPSTAGSYSSSSSSDSSSSSSALDYQSDTSTAYATGTFVSVVAAAIFTFMFM